MLVLPYHIRVPVAGWITSRVIAPIAGYSRRVHENLALIFPDMPRDEVRRLTLGVTNNVGRTVCELWSGDAFVRRVKDLPLEGPGAAALEAAHAERRPVILATGHFGNYDAARAALIARGYRVGALYKPMKNQSFDIHYIRAISTIGTPLFPRGRKGFGNMVRFLRDGGMLGLLMDLRVAGGQKLTFFGQPALTATSAADLALRYDAPLIPIYAVRQADGLSFRILVFEPIPPGDPIAMSQAINDGLEALVRDHMEQWFWVHRRWK
jgi:KDO2-lipid IV(A) lauroyltransferase